MGENPYLDSAGMPTELGRSWLSRAVTDVDGPVYAIRPELPPVVAVGAMARLSRNPYDMRRVMLEEFAAGLPLEQSQSWGTGEAAEAFIRRVLTAFGDDSVAQLLPVMAVVERCSNLATKLLEWGRVGSAYLEQSTRYLIFDGKDESGRYRYYRPHELPPDRLARYEWYLDQIMDLYSLVVRDLTDQLRAENPLPSDADKAQAVAWRASTRAAACDVARNMLPVAIRSTVALSMTAQAYESLIVHLFAEELPEARKIGLALLQQMRRVAPAFLERADMPERGLALAAYRAQQRSDLNRLADRLRYRGQGSLFADSLDDDVQLLAVTGDEEMVATGAVFAGFPGGYTDARQRICSAEGAQAEILAAAMRGRTNRRCRPPRAFELCHVLWQLKLPYGIYRDLQRHRIVDGWERQPISPRLGYDVPQLVVDKGHQEMFERAFSLSEELYNSLMGSGFEHHAEYACLMGHKVRWLFMCNLREWAHLVELRTGPGAHPVYKAACLKMHAALEARVPGLTAGMNFVDREPSELFVRQAALQGRTLAMQRLGMELPDEE